jgi:hypothetical protein
MRTRIVVVGWSLSLPIVLLAPAWTSEYDGNKPVTVKGVVMKIEWTHPRVHFDVDSTDQNQNVASPEARSWSTSASRTINTAWPVVSRTYSRRRGTEQVRSRFAGPIGPRIRIGDIEFRIARRDP